MAYPDRLNSVNNYFSEGGVKHMMADMWIDDHEYNLNFSNLEEFARFKCELGEAFVAEARFNYPREGVYHDLKDVKSIFIYEVV